MLNPQDERYRHRKPLADGNFCIGFCVMHKMSNEAASTLISNPYTYSHFWKRAIREYYITLANRESYQHPARITSFPISV